MREIIEDLETRRKIFHLLALSLWLIPLAYLPKIYNILLFILVLVANLLTVLNLGREKLSFYYQFVYKLEREKNYSRPGIQALWANFGIFLSFLLFGKESAMVSVVVLAVGDAFASMVGIKYGKRRIGNKSLEGSLAFFLSSFLALCFFLGFYKSFLVALFSSLAEAFSFKLDDNFTVPLTAGFVCWML